MTTLDSDDKDLINVGLYRWLKASNKLAAQTGNSALSEGQFVKAGWQSYTGVASWRMTVIVAVAIMTMSVLTVTNGCSVWMKWGVFLHHDLSKRSASYSCRLFTRYVLGAVTWFVV